MKIKGVGARETGRTRREDKLTLTLARLWNKRTSSYLHHIMTLILQVLRGQTCTYPWLSEWVAPYFYYNGVKINIKKNQHKRLISEAHCTCLIDNVKLLTHTSEATRESSPIKSDVALWHQISYLLPSAQAHT